tara:strand:+ start:57120 stop:57947 length:828 start_codon:yes stop_codon:yes gene_type:complete
MSKMHFLPPVICPKFSSSARRFIGRFLLCLLPFQVSLEKTVDLETSLISTTALKDAVALYKTGDLDQAREAFLHILDTQPKEPNALFYLGHINTDLISAEQYFLQVILSNPQHNLADDALLELARINFTQKKYKETASKCNKILKTYPDTNLINETYLLLGQALLAESRPALARIVFQEILPSNPSSILSLQARRGIADSYRDQAYFIDAAREYIKLEIDFPQADSLETVLWNAGNCLSKAGRSFEAVLVYQRLIKLYPRTVQARKAQTEIHRLK